MFASVALPFWRSSVRTGAHASSPRLGILVIGTCSHAGRSWRPSRQSAVFLCRGRPSPVLPARLWDRGPSPVLPSRLRGRGLGPLGQGHLLPRPPRRASPAAPRFVKEEESAAIRGAVQQLSCGEKERQGQWPRWTGWLVTNGAHLAHEIGSSCPSPAACARS